MTVLCCVGLCLAVNLICDPLWYSGGTKVGRFNLAYNERLSKLIRFRSFAKRPDCLVFGNSRSTLLQTRNWTAIPCYNFAFSGGRLSEYASYARYLADDGYSPRRVIIGYGIEDLRNPPAHVDAFVLDHEPPPSPFESYVSLDAFEASIKTVLQIYPIDRVYTHDFDCVPVPDHGLYSPPPLRPPGPDDSDSFVPQVLDHLKTIRKAFPRAKLVTFVPPVSAWRTAQLDRDGELDDALRLLHAGAQQSDETYDFMVPSSITTDPKATYDGSHYLLPANEKVASILQGGPAAAGTKSEFVVDLERTSLDDYLELYEQRLASFEKRLAARAN